MPVTELQLYHSLIRVADTCGHEAVARVAAVLVASSLDQPSHPIAVPTLPLIWIAESHLVIADRVEQMPAANVTVTDNRKSAGKKYIMTHLCFEFASFFF